MQPQMMLIFDKETFVDESEALISQLGGAQDVLGAVISIKCCVTAVLTEASSRSSDSSGLLGDSEPTADMAEQTFASSETRDAFLEKVLPQGAGQGAVSEETHCTST